MPIQEEIGQRRAGVGERRLPVEYVRNVSERVKLGRHLRVAWLEVRVPEPHQRSTVRVILVRQNAPKAVLHAELNDP